MSNQFLTFSERQYAGAVLEKLGQAIDLTDSQYQDAIDRYGSVGRFLGDPTGSLYIYNPRLVPQGSFRIGTVVRPDRDDCEFDVDTTCWLYINLPNSQYRIKKLIADRLNSSATYQRMLKEKHRCWRLIYSEATHFHLDIVPAVPDDYQWLLRLGVPEKYAKHAIKITDNRNSNYYDTTTEFPRSNPEGYALWFLDVMQVQADQIRNKLSIELKMSIDKIPEYKVRTPLQRAVQLMKKHRDQLYGDNDLKPISVIITTLAARSYTDVMMHQSSSNLFYDIVLKIVEQMPNYIEKRNGTSWITNPVNPSENFADKWLGEPRLEAKFYEWHNRFLSLLKGSEISKQFEAAPEILNLSFGINTVRRAFGVNSQDTDRLSRLRTTASVIGSSNAYTNSEGHITSNPNGTKNQEHRFHFNDK
ncbi:nucleotidyltransferase domain-containing protein [Pedobacter borealis]|uniref:nucleotidyltransferase domain-containing protein n=1 Tax=Pedobacter borealis TaxID=475254 RepID=UPI0004937032|nr:nucleotidyltransferase [Pedobacter borealis]